MTVCPLNDARHLFSVSSGLMQRLKPHVTQRQHRVSVVLSGRLLKDAFKLLLPGTPLLLRQVKVTNQRPGIRVVLQNTIYLYRSYKKNPESQDAQVKIINIGQKLQKKPTNYRIKKRKCCAATALLQQYYS